MRKLALGLVVTLILGGMLNFSAWAQLGVGRIKGIVRDTSGAVIVGASVVARHESTGVETKMASNGAGEYVFESVPIGSYTLTVTVSGFRTEIARGVRVVSGETNTMDFALTVGAVTQTVAVTAAPPVLNTTENTTGTTMTSEEVSGLPLQMLGAPRTALGFVQAVPGVSYDDSQLGAGSNSAAGTAINGALAGEASYHIDGVDASLNGWTQLSDNTNPLPESVAEFRITSDSSVEYGANGGTGIELTLKSGTNQLHGSGWEYVRNPAFDSRNFFAATTNIDKENEFGVVVGGPVVLPKIYNGRNRTFFFATYDGWRYRLGNAGTVLTVPTAQMLGGDFRQLLGPQMGTDTLGRPIYQGEIYDPSTTRPTGVGGFIRDPFMYKGQMNVIDPSRLSSLSKFFQTGFPAPNLPGTVSNWVGLPLPEKHFYDTITGKVDEVFSPSHRITFAYANTLRGAVNEWLDNGLGPLISPAFNAIQQQYRYRFSYYWNIRPNLLLNINGAVQRTPKQDNDTLGLASATGGTAAGLKGVVAPYTPWIAIPGYGQYGYIGYVFSLYRYPGQSVPANLAMSWTKGSHDFKFGAQYINYQTANFNDLFGAGEFDFSPLESGLPGYSATGQAYASYLLGETDNAYVSSLTSYKPIVSAWGFYVQDQWRVTPKLTLNYGLRYDLTVPPHTRGDAFGAFDPTIPNPGSGGLPGALTFWGQGPGRNGRHLLYDYYYKAFGPQIGLAYQLNPKTVVRAHYAIAYPPHSASMTGGNGAPQDGYSATVTDTSLDNGVTPAFQWDNGFPKTFPALPLLDPTLFNGSAVSYIPQKEAAKPGRTQNLNIGVERELPGQIALKVDYIGALSHGLPTNGLIQLNQIPLSDLSMGNLLLQDINSPQAKAAGIPLPYAGFTGSVAQALRPYPQYQGVTEEGAAAGFLLYHSLQANVQKRFGNGLNFLVAYTIAKSEDNGYARGQGMIIQNSAQASSIIDTAKALSQIDRPETLNISYTYELPFGPGKRFASTTNPVMRELVEGWKIAGLQSYVSGIPVVIATYASIPGGFGGIWANRVPGVPTTTGVGCGNYDPHDPTRNRYLNINAFSTPAPFTLGNTSVQPNTRNCGYLNENLGVSKDFRINERSKFELGADFFNAFNRHRWTGLQTNIGNPAAFGQYTGASYPRQIQLYGKFHF